MKTNEISTVTVYLDPLSTAVAPAFTGSHVKLDHTWLMNLGGEWFGLWQMKGDTSCVLIIGDQTTLVPMTALTLVVATSSFLLVIGFLLVFGAKPLKQAKRA